MPSYVTPKKNTAYVASVSLGDQADANKFKINPTLAAGDVKVSIDNGPLTNITTLPVVTPAGSGLVKVSLSAAEMNGDSVDVYFADVAGAEWSDAHLPIQTTAQQIDDLSTFDPATDDVAVVTTNTDMRGTDNANTVVPDNAGITANGVAIGSLNDVTAADILNTQITEGYAADGVAPTLAQSLMLLQQTLGDFAISGTTITVKKLDGTSTAATYTLDNSTTPTSRTRTA